MPLKIFNGEKKKRYMENLIFDSYEDLVLDLIDNVTEDRYACAILFYTDACKLLKEFASFDEVTIGDVELISAEYNGYSKEYCVSVDNDLQVSVYPLWHGDNKFSKAGYLDIGKAYVLLHGDVNSIILKSATESICKEFEIDENDYYEEENCMCGCDLMDIIEFMLDM